MSDSTGFTDDKYRLKKSLFGSQVRISNSQGRLVMRSVKKKKGFLSRKRTIQIFYGDSTSPRLKVSPVVNDCCERKISLKDRSGKVGRISASKALFRPFSIYVTIHGKILAEWIFEKPQREFSLMDLVYGLVFMVLSPFIIPLAGVAIVLGLAAIVLGLLAFRFIFVAYLAGLIPPSALLHFVDREDQIATLQRRSFRGLSLIRHISTGDMELCLILSILRIYRVPCLVGELVFKEGALQPIESVKSMPKSINSLL